jgi:hypothetical protein
MRNLLFKTKVYSEKTIILLYLEMLNLCSEAFIKIKKKDLQMDYSVECQNNNHYLVDLLKNKIFFNLNQENNKKRKSKY